MDNIRSTLVLLSGCAALVGLGCDSHVQLGAFSATVPNILWSATFETGDLTEWKRDGDGDVYYENAAASPTVTMEQFHNGRYAGKSTMGPTTEPTGIASSSYFYRNQPSPTEAYYGAWFYIPSTVTIRTWLSLMHFRCSITGDGMNPVAFWDLNVWPVRDGSLPSGTLPIGALTTHFFNYTTTMVNADPLVYQVVPTDRWVHFEILMRKAADTTGRMTVWQDDVMIIDLPNVITSYNDWVQWETGGASNDIAPASASIYMDDATISLERLGDQAIPDERPQPKNSVRAGEPSGSTELPASGTLKVPGGDTHTSSTSPSSSDDDDLLRAPIQLERQDDSSPLAALPAEGRGSAGAGSARLRDARFREIYETWFDHILKWLYAFGVPSSDTEDLAQEIFLVVRRKLARFDGTNLAGWLYRITQLTVRDHRRRSWFKNLVVRRREINLTEVSHGGDSPERRYEQRENRRIFQDLMDKMSEKRRTTFVLFEVEGYSGQEIAEMHDVPLGTVWTRLHHARKDFRRLVKGQRREELKKT